MKVKDLSTMIYDQLSEVNILKFGHTYPIPEAIKSFWHFKNVIDCAKILSENNDSAETDLINIIKASKNLEELIANGINSSSLFENVLSTTINHCPKIKYLYLDDAVMNKEQITILCQCTTLEKLSLWSVVDNETLENLFSSCPKLRYFKVTAEEFILIGSESNLITFPMKLECLEVRHPFNMMSRSNSIQDYFAQCQKSEIVFMSSLETVAPYLNFLSLDLYLDNLYPLKNFVQLRTLFLNFAVLLNDNDIKIITENCTLLEEISLYQFSCLLSERAFGCFGNLPELKSLSIGGQYFLPNSQYNKCMSGLSKCAKLESLTVLYCGLTNYAVTKIVQQCLRLSHLTIMGCEVTNDVIYDISQEFLAQRTNQRYTKLKLKVAGAKPSETHGTYTLLPEVKGYYVKSTICVMRINVSRSIDELRPRIIEVHFDTNDS